MRSIFLGLFLTWLLLQCSTPAWSQSPKTPFWKGLSIEASLTSAPSREIWASLGLGIHRGRNSFGLILFRPELRSAYHSWFRAYGYEQSEKVAFGAGHRYDLWRKNRWFMTTNTIFQVQRINIYDADFIAPLTLTFLGSYPRLQLSTGMGIGFRIAKGFYAFQSVRYGVAHGNFFIERPIPDRWQANICADISIGFEL